MGHKLEKILLATLLLIMKGPPGRSLYSDFRRNFWLDYSTPKSTMYPDYNDHPPPTSPSPPSPAFLHPATNGSVQTVPLGQTTHIDCMVHRLMGHQVSWIKREGRSLHLLTTDRLVFSADGRFSVVHVPPHNWRLIIRSAQPRDEAHYVCQLSTHPPMFIGIKLIVIVPSLSMVDEMGDPVIEKYYKPGSTVVLTCQVTNYRSDFLPPVWSKNGQRIAEAHKSGHKGERRIHVSYGADGSLESRLYLGGTGKTQAGNYSCKLPALDLEPANITLLVTQGEETAAIQSEAHRQSSLVVTSIFLASTFLLILK